MPQDKKSKALKEKAGNIQQVGMLVGAVRQITRLKEARHFFQRLVERLGAEKAASENIRQTFEYLTKKRVRMWEEVLREAKRRLIAEAIRDAEKKGAYEEAEHATSEVDLD